MLRADGCIRVSHVRSPGGCSRQREQHPQRLRGLSVRRKACVTGPSHRPFCMAGAKAAEVGEAQLPWASWPEQVMLRQNPKERREGGSQADKGRGSSWRQG